MKGKIVFVAKIVSLVAILGLINIVLIYLVEQLEIISITPLTIPDYTESHLSNILIPFPFLFVRAGWAYLVGIILFHYIQKNYQISGGQKILIGIAIAISAFFIWWLFEREIDFLVEGLIVYPLMGCIMVALHHFLFKLRE